MMDFTEKTSRREICPCFSNDFISAPAPINFCLSGSFAFSSIEEPICASSNLMVGAQILNTTVTDSYTEAQHSKDAGIYY